MHFKGFILIIFCIFHTGYSQETYQVKVEKGSSSTNIVGRAITEDIYGNIFAVSTESSGLSQIHLTKVNYQGIKEWDTLYSFTPFAEFLPKIIPTSDGGVIIGCLSFSYPIMDQDSIQDILLWKINGKGEIEWQKILEALTFFDLISTQDGNCFVLGSMFNYRADLLGYKITEQGDVLWEKTYGNPDLTSSPRGLAEINGEIYISAQESETSNSEFVRENTIYKLNSDGDQIWELKIKKKLTNQNTSIRRIFEFNNQIYFNWDKYYKLNSVTSEYESLDTSNTFLEFGIDITCDKLILKAIRVPSDTMGVLLYRHYDEIGDFTFEKVIPNTIGQSYAQTVTQDGGFVFLSSDNKSIQITKLDCQGNLDFWDTNCNPVFRPESYINLFPNPTNDILNIEANFEITNISIYNLLGQNIPYTKKCLCNEISINLSFLPSNIYFISIEGETETISKRIVKI